MTDYPISFPCVSRIEGHSAQLAAGLVRTPMNSGNARQRRAFRNLPHTLALVFIVEQRLYASWLAWVNAHAWDDWIRLRLPGLHAAALDADTAPTPVRFITDLQAELLPVHRLWFWRVRVAAEYMPIAGDLPILLDAGWVIGGTPVAPSIDWILAGTPATPAGDFVNPGTPAFPVTFA